MSRLPIRLRLTLAFAVSMALVLVGVGAILYVRLGHSLDEQIRDRLTSRSDGIRTLLRTSPPDELRLPPEDDGFALVAGPSAGVASDPEARSLVLTPAEREAAREQPLIVERRVSGSDGESYRARLLVRYVQDGSVLVATGESLEDRDEALGALLTQLLIALPLALLSSSAIGYLVAGAALRPMEAMRREAAEISSTSSGRRLPLPAADDEVRRLGATMNEMLARLDAGLERERQFVADASHELRTPLAILKAELELALRQPRSPQELEAALRSATEETDRLVQLAEDLLVVAQADRGTLHLDRTRCRVEELLEEVAQRFQLVADGRAIAVEPSSLELCVDRVRLARAVGNLVDNALRHGSGTVTVRAVQRGSVIELVVGDEGAGFEESVLPVAFERFTRADSARGNGGTGLGLAIVDAIARAHGGSVGVRRREGGGAQVWIAVPSGLNVEHAARGDRIGVG